MLILGHVSAVNKHDQTLLMRREGLGYEMEENLLEQGDLKDHSTEADPVQDDTLKEDENSKQDEPTEDDAQIKDTPREEENDTPEEDDSPEEDDTPKDTASPMGGDGASKNEVASSSEACTALVNQGSNFAVSVAVGTPEQPFDLVADTGSDAVIVASCICNHKGGCTENNRCFKGGDNTSSTFSVTDGGVDITFGSGKVETVIASDVVKVAGIKATMSDGLLLMLDRRKLQIYGKFEGILGLGPPTPMKTRTEKGGDPDNSYDQRMFMQEAGVERFTLCFNDNGNDGALRMNVPEFQNALPAIGTQHWALGLHGISVGSEIKPAILCSKGDMQDGQVSPCGAIPDSGTTLVLGPEDQVSELFEGICNEWKRCREREGRLKSMSGADAFTQLITQCSEWLTDDEGIAEIPSIFLALGTPPNLQQIELTAWSYIVTGDLGGLSEIDQATPTSGVLDHGSQDQLAERIKVCQVGIQSSKPYLTKKNGEVWILGEPLFFQYSVGFDLKGPSIAFKAGACTGCEGSLLDSRTQFGKSGKELPRPMRTSRGAPRIRKYDTSLPL